MVGFNSENLEKQELGLTVIRSSPLVQQKEPNIEQIFREWPELRKEKGRARENLIEDIRKEYATQLEVTGHHGSGYL